MIQYTAIAEVLTTTVSDNDGEVDAHAALACDVANVIAAVVNHDPSYRQGISESCHRVTIDPETGGITIWREML